MNLKIISSANESFFFLCSYEPENKIARPNRSVVCFTELKIIREDREMHGT